MLYPYIRILRASTACLIFSHNPIEVVAATELASIFVPCLNTKTVTKNIGILLAIMYLPKFASALVPKLFDMSETEMKCELFGLSFLFITLLLQY